MTQSQTSALAIWCTTSGWAVWCHGFERICCLTLSTQTWDMFQMFKTLTAEASRFCLLPWRLAWHWMAQHGWKHCIEWGECSVARDFCNETQIDACPSRNDHLRWKYVKMVVCFHLAIMFSFIYWHDHTWLWCLYNSHHDSWLSFIISMMMADDDGDDCDCDGVDDYDCVQNFHYRYATILYRYPPCFAFHRFKVGHRNLHCRWGKTEQRVSFAHMMPPLDLLSCGPQGTLWMLTCCWTSRWARRQWGWIRRPERRIAGFDRFSRHLGLGPTSKRNG